MANIKNLQMWKDICADSRIAIRKSLFGLKTTATYVPTQSIIDARTIEYTARDGEQLQRILKMQKSDLKDIVSGFHPKEAVNGNYMMEVVRSRDGRFVCLLLLQFNRLNYEPVTDVVVYENNEAEIINQLF